MGGVLTDWQKAVNTIAHALNGAGYDSDSPESKALELLAGRCEGTADAKEIAMAAINAVDDVLEGHIAIACKQDVKDYMVAWVSDIIAPLLKPSVDVGKMAETIVSANSQSYRRVDRGVGVPETERLIRASLTDSSAEIAALRSELDKVRGLVETCWQYCKGTKPGPGFDEMHAELYHYMHDIGRIGCAKAALSGEAGKEAGDEG